MNSKYNLGVCGGYSSQGCCCKTHVHGKPRGRIQLRLQKISRLAVSCQVSADASDFAARNVEVVESPNRLAKKSHKVDKTLQKSIQVAHEQESNADVSLEDAEATIDWGVELDGFDEWSSTVMLEQFSEPQADDSRRRAVADAESRVNAGRYGKDADGAIVQRMPPLPQCGLLADVSGLEVDALCTADEVYNKELSWLAFNWRVLAMATEASTPLYERLRFLGITSSNLDGFFAKRVGGLMRQRDAGAANLKKPLLHRWPPEKQLELIAKEVKRMVSYKMDTLKHQVLPALKDADFRILSYEELNEQGAARLNSFYQRQLELLLTPIKLDPGHPFPYLPSHSLNLAVILEDPRVRDARQAYAIVNIPTSFMRWYVVPADAAKEGHSWRQGFMPVEQVIIHNLGQLFGGMKLQGVHCFRVTRNASLERHEEEAEDLLDMISDELRERRFAPFVRLEVDASMPEDLLELLATELNLHPDKDVYKMDTLLDLAGLLTLPVDSRELAPRLLYPVWSPQTHPRLSAPYRQKNIKRNKTIAWAGNKWKGIRSIFSIIRDGDILLHHPYHSFASSVQRLVEEAARDPDVVAIKATLYRTSDKSPIINALLKALENGKQVAVLVELKARFDEARNVGFAQRLEEAGCHVAYGLVGLKTHCKVMLVVRREKAAPHGLRTYVHIGTGNYNPHTAGVYTDLGLITCHPSLGDDIVDLFKYLTGLHSQEAVGGFRSLLVAPAYMNTQLVAMIDAEIEAAKAGRTAALCIKVNGLDHNDMVGKLYEAAEEGVRVDAIVRGVCRLRPGVEGRSRNVRVISIIGRFLEHHRIYCFYNNGKPLYYISSADWLNRNLQGRVEVAAPVYDPGLQRQLREVLALCLHDHQNAWEMMPDGSYIKPACRSSEAVLAAPLLDADATADETDVLQELGEYLGSQDALQCMTSEETGTPAPPFCVLAGYITAPTLTPPAALQAQSTTPPYIN